MEPACQQIHGKAGWQTLEKGSFASEAVRA